MKTRKLVFVLIGLVALCAIHSNAFAQATATPTPTVPTWYIDSDGDGFGVDGSNLPAALKPSGLYVANKDDCDDSNPRVHPKATEILDNDTDEDCDGDDLKSPSAGVLRAFGCPAGNVRAIKKLIKEMEVCDASSECTVDKTSGRFITSYQHYFIDDNCDGIKDTIIDQDKKDEMDVDRKRGYGCRPPAPPKPHKPVSAAEAAIKVYEASTSAGPGTTSGADAGAVGTVSAAGTPPPLPLEDRFKEIENIADSQGDRLASVEDAIKAVSTERLGGLETALANEAVLREQADTELGERVDVIEADVVVLKKDVGSARSEARRAGQDVAFALGRGVSAGIDVGGAIKAQSDIALKKGVARGGFAPMVLFGGHVGAETAVGYYRAIGSIGIPFDEGPSGDYDAGMLYQIGGDMLFKLSPGSGSAVGFTASYLDQESGGTVLEVNARSRGVKGGLAYLSSGSNWLRTELRIAAEGGVESLGTQGKNGKSAFKALDTKPFGMFTITVGLGTGTPSP